MAPTGLNPAPAIPSGAGGPPGVLHSVEAVRAQRETPPYYGKDKIAHLLRQEDWNVSTSTVGRTLGYLKRHGVLREPPRPSVTRRKPAWRVRMPSANRGTTSPRNPATSSKSTPWTCARS